MKISIFSAFHPFRGGIAQFNERFAEELEKNHQVSKFTFKVQYPKLLFPGKSQFVDGIEDAKKPFAERIVSTFNPFSYFGGARKIVKSQPELFITNYWMSFFGPFLGFFGRKLSKKAKRIAIVHNLIPHEKRFFDTFFTRLFIKHYDGFVVLSEEVKKDVLILKPNAKTLLIEHPLYDHFGEKLERELAHKTLGLDASKKTLLFFGIIRDYKGLDLLIDAMQFLPSDYQLIIVGEIYGDASKYENQISSSNRKDDIVLINKFVENEEVSPYFSAADLCVLPYRSATQSGVTATSHFFEIPTLVTNVGGLKETVDHLKTGYIVDSLNPQDLAIGIVDFFRLANLEEVKANMQALKSKRSWKQFATEVLNFALELK